jgi:hypothetical protein
MSEANNTPVDKGPVFDQFILCEQVGVVTSNRLMKLLRNTRKQGPILEGKLAAICGERMFLPEWPGFINLLLQWGYIKTQPTGKGVFRTVQLTELGEEFMTHCIGPKEPEQPTTEVASGIVNA